jgi:hypothetical protein
VLPTRSVLIAGLVPAIAALVAAFPAPAAAAAATFTDPRGDTTHPADIVAVHVENEDRIVVVVQHANLTFRDGPGKIRIAYDTVASHSGPEFYLRLAYQSDQAPELRATTGWGHFHSPPIATCVGEHARVRPGRDKTRISVPRSCFGDPGQVRVQVRLAPFKGDDRRVDLAPGPRMMGPWVAH